MTYAHNYTSFTISNTMSHVSMYCHSYIPGRCTLSLHLILTLAFCIYYNLWCLPVDGGWSAWTAWSKCPVKCGLEGKQWRNRLCNNPIPMRYGWLCPGPALDYKGCIKHCKKTGNQRT